MYVSRTRVSKYFVNLRSDWLLLQYKVLFLIYSDVVMYV